MFVLENDGYEIERWVHGEEASYNDIPKWKYSQIPDAFTPAEKASERHVKTYKIRTRNELEALLADEEFSNGRGLRVSRQISFSVEECSYSHNIVRGNAYA